jgi:hypothetical protein
MAAYSNAHYGTAHGARSPEASSSTTPGDTFASAYNTFASDHPDPELHEWECVRPLRRDTDGTIFQLATDDSLRHTVGLNYTATGSTSARRRQASSRTSIRRCLARTDTLADVPLPHCRAQCVGHVRASRALPPRARADLHSDPGDWNALRCGATALLARAEKARRPRCHGHRGRPCARCRRVVEGSPSSRRPNRLSTRPAARVRHRRRRGSGARERRVVSNAGRGAAAVHGAVCVTTDSRRPGRRTA